jgi:hypothetical protein
MRIVGWNLGYAFSFRRRHDQAWHYLAALDPDIAPSPGGPATGLGS